jgi:hypothetical protein
MTLLASDRGDPRASFSGSHGSLNSLQIDCSRARLPTGMRADRRWVAVFVLALVALLSREASLPHQHIAATPGLFNHDHDLCTLATVTGGLVPDSPEPAPLLVSLAPATLVALAVRAVSPRCLADPRAPPPPEPPRSA